MNLAVPAEHWIKLKENEKKSKYLNLARELKKLWIMKVTVIPIVISAPGTVTKWLINGLGDLEIRERAETNQTRTLLRRVFETRGDLSTNSSERPSANTNE